MFRWWCWKKWHNGDDGDHGNKTLSCPRNRAARLQPRLRSVTTSDISQERQLVSGSETAGCEHSGGRGKVSVRTQRLSVWRWHGEEEWRWVRSKRTVSRMLCKRHRKSFYGRDKQELWGEKTSRGLYPPLSPPSALEFAHDILCSLQLVYDLLPPPPLRFLTTTFQSFPLDNLLSGIHVSSLP